MLEPTSVLQHNREEAVGEVIDGEAIIIRPSDGVYYSLDGTGSFVWEQLEEGRALAQLVSAVAAHFEVAPEQAEQDLRQFATQLLDERLIVLNDTPPTGGVPPDNQTVTEKQAYEAPQLNIYRDMRDLLALDPPAPGMADIPWNDPPA